MQKVRIDHFPTGNFMANGVDLLLKRWPTIMFFNCFRTDLTEELIATTKLLGGYIIKELRDLSKENAQNKEHNIKLTDRHLMILKLLAEGLTEEEVGKEMYISRNTIKYHKKTIFSELGVKNSKEAVAKALGLNLISLQ